LPHSKERLEAPRPKTLSLVNDAQRSAGCVRFSAFEFNPQIGELLKHGLKIKLSGQPIELLAMLLEAARPSSRLPYCFDDRRPYADHDGAHGHHQPRGSRREQPESNFLWATIQELSDFALP
jgi:hypothetical protein